MPVDQRPHRGSLPSPTLFPLDRSRALSEVSLAFVQAARERIGSCIRTSPTMLAWLPRGERRIPITLKMESLQTGQTVASRGVINLVHATPPDRVGAGLVTVWLGLFAPAVLRVGLEVGAPTTAVMCRPMAWPEAIQMFQRRGGKVVVAGRDWHGAERLARRRAQREGACFVHPFADPLVVNGCGTLALELFETVRPPAVVVIPASPSCGLGLLGVFGMLAKQLQPGVRVVGAELADAPLLFENLKHAGPVQALTDIAPEFGPDRPDQLNTDLARRHVDEIVLVSNEDVRAALETLWEELEAGSSPAGVTALAAVLSGKLTLHPDESVVVVLTETGFHGLFGGSAAPRVGID